MLLYSSVLFCRIFALCSRFLYYVRVRVPYIQENAQKRIICRLQPFSCLLDRKYLFCRLSIFAAAFQMMLVLSLFLVRLQYISSRFNPWFYMQVFVYLCSIEMYIYAICYDKQKTLWEFRVFLHVCKTSYLITLRFSAYFMF